MLLPISSACKKERLGPFSKEGVSNGFFIFCSQRGLLQINCGTATSNFFVSRLYYLTVYYKKKNSTTCCKIQADFHPKLVSQITDPLHKYSAAWRSWMTSQQSGTNLQHVKNNARSASGPQPNARNKLGSIHCLSNSLRPIYQTPKGAGQVCRRSSYFHTRRIKAS